VSGDGEQVSFGFIDDAGEPASLKVPIAEIGSLAMTLPSLLEQAMRARNGDEKLRYTYPLGAWTLEHAADRDRNLLTLRTVDGFSVCFNMFRSAQKELGEALVSGVEPQTPAMGN
jgi:hypothetical protein